MTRFIAQIFGNAGGLWLSSVVIAGITLPQGETPLKTAGLVLVVALILALVQNIIRPVVKFLTYLLYILTLGLFSVVVNALMLLISANFSTRLGVEFHVDTFSAAILAAIIISVCALICQTFFDKEKRRAENGR